MMMRIPDARNAKVSARFSGEIAAQYPATDVTDEVCEGIYAVLDLHRENCPACDGQGIGECPVGDTLIDAWGLSKVFRDSYRRARKATGG